jgi:hypothetical protein
MVSASRPYNGERMTMTRRDAVRFLAIALTVLPLSAMLV